jgi:NAD(P)-dependent dehydrogenase (short-subunit alcohol dehydrogenase family)
MLDRGFGRIIKISSVVGETGAFGQVNYAASKSGLAGLAKEPGAGDGPEGHHRELRGPGATPTRT